MPVRPDWFDPDLLVKTTLRGYRLEKFLGAGGFGAVYLTHDANGQPRAVKVLFPPHSLGVEDRHVWDVRANRFLREALTARGFQHPSIIRVFDQGETPWEYRSRRPSRPGQPDPSGTYLLKFFTAEYIPDGVERHLKSSKLFAPDEALRIGLQVCEALEALHSASPQVLHRDLNPGNIRLAEDGRVVVADFGLAHSDDLPPDYVTREGPSIHPGVGAPEQHAGENADVRTDIYQWGALLLVMLTSKYPRDGGAELLRRRADVPQPLKAVILKCLQRERAERFQGVADLKAAWRSPAPGNLQAGLLRPLWNRPLPSANWRIGTTPVAESRDGCYVWGRHSVHSIAPATGSIKWSWPWASSGPEAEISNGPENPAVQTLGQLVFVRHGRFLSCLRAPDGSEQWRRPHWSDVAGTFLTARGLIVVDSHGDRDDAPRGPAALLAETGAVVWGMEQSECHVASMAAVNEVLVLVEHCGIGGSRGVRVRFVAIASGEALGVHQVLPPGGQDSEKLDEYASQFGRGTPRAFNPGAQHWRSHRPIFMPDGAFVVWLNDLRSPYLHALCFEPSLALRWDRLWEGPLAGGGDAADVKAPAITHLAGAAGRLLAFGAGHGADPSRGWVASIDLANGAPSGEHQLPSGAIPSSAAMTPDGTVAFVVASQPPAAGKGAGRWNLLALSGLTGKEVSREREGDSPGGLVPLAPIVTDSRIYLQVPSASTRAGGRANLAKLPGMVEAFQWR